MGPFFRRPLCSVSIRRPDRGPSDREASPGTSQAAAVHGRVHRERHVPIPSRYVGYKRARLGSKRHGTSNPPRSASRTQARSPGRFLRATGESTRTLSFFSFEKTAEAPCSINPRSSRRPSVRFLSFPSLLSLLALEALRHSPIEFCRVQGSRGRGDRRAASNR